MNSQILPQFVVLVLSLGLPPTRAKVERAPAIPSVIKAGGLPSHNCLRPCSKGHTRELLQTRRNDPADLSSTYQRGLTPKPESPANRCTQWCVSVFVIDQHREGPSLSWHRRSTPV